MMEERTFQSVVELHLGKTSSHLVVARAPVHCEKAGMWYGKTFTTTRIHGQVAVDSDQNRSSAAQENEWSHTSCEVIRWDAISDARSAEEVGLMEKINQCSLC